jgi:hypothetical protein
MAKKNQGAAGDSDQRQTRKDVLLARKQREQLRMVRIGVAAVVAMVLLVIIVAVVNEYILSPRREVATVNGETITLKEFQDRVRFERAQRIMTLEDQLEMVNNDVGLIQQFSGQLINELQDPQTLGESALNSMAQDRLMIQALAERGIEITDEEIDQRIEQAYNYFGGESPTPVPTPTDEPQPTPSLTPVGAEAVEATPEEPVPTSEPFPTATPVSLESFQEEFDSLISRYKDMGVSESVYRTAVAGSIAAERLLEVLSEETGLSDEDLQASAYILDFPSQKEAEDALAEIESSDFLTVWNTIKSAPPEQSEEASDPASATEILWQTRDTLAGSLSEEEVAAIFDAPLNEPSAIIETSGFDGNPRFLIVMPSGREVRPLSASELRNRQIALLTQYLNDRTATDVVIGDYWRSRVPALPILDPMFLQAPTATPPLPEDTGGTE